MSVHAINCFPGLSHFAAIYFHKNIPQDDHVNKSLAKLNRVTVTSTGTSVLLASNISHNVLKQAPLFTGDQIIHP